MHKTPALRIESAEQLHSNFAEHINIHYSYYSPILFLIMMNLKEVDI